MDTQPPTTPPAPIDRTAIVEQLARDLSPQDFTSGDPARQEDAYSYAREAYDWFTARYWLVTRS